MKRVLLFLTVSAFLISNASAGVIASDTFSYPNGSLTAVSGGLWVPHSGGGSLPVAVTGGEAYVKSVTAAAEDLSLFLPITYGTNSGVTLYSSFTLKAINLPTLNGTYVAHHRDANSGALTGFGARVWLSATNVAANGPTAPGKFRIGVVNGNAGGPGTGQLDVDLDTNVTYTVVTRFVLATGTATLWINPAVETDPGVTAIDVSTNGVNNAIDVIAYCLRQGAQTPGGSMTNVIDNVKIGTRFSDVAGANTAPLISAIPDQTIPGNSSTAALPFQVTDSETVASGLTVSATSSNAVLVPNNPANLTLGGTSTNRTITVTPAVGQEGQTTIAVIVSDGTNDSVTTFSIKVGFPSISAIPNQITVSNTPTAAIPFTVNDGETLAANLNVSGSSSNPGLVASGGISFGGSGSNRTVTITPEPNQTGLATITVNVDDTVNTNSTSFIVTVRPLLGVVFSDTFSYDTFPFSSNGLYLASGSPQVGGTWAHASPTGTNFFEVQVITNLGVAELSRSLNEDVGASLSGGPYAPASAAVLYTGFKLVNTSLPSQNGNYFVHLKDSDTGTTFRSKAFAVTTNAAAGKFRIGVSATANLASPTFPRDLSTNQAYLIVMRYNVGTGETRLWVNPTSESSPSVDATDPLVLSTIGSIGLRQDSGIGTNQIDNLVISGSAFADVAPAITPESIQTQISGGNLTLTWTNPLFALQSATSVEGPYSDVPNATSPYSTPLAGPQQFFRLKY